MRDMFKVLSAISILFATMPVANAASYDIDPKHSFIHFTVSHLGIGQVIGQFTELSGHLKYDEKKPSQSSINLAVNTKSLDTSNKKRNEHLKSEDFFHVSKHLFATFSTTKVNLDGETGRLQGELSILGKTKKVDVDVTKLGEGKDPWGGYRVGFKGVTTIDRRDFGMDYNLGESAYTVVIEVVIEGIRNN